MVVDARDAMHEAPHPMAERPAPELNGPQAEAVAHAHGPLLVFAGAGSGKTRVITYRVANLVATHRVPPYRVLAVTFTNKAAGEMRNRLDGLLGAEITRDLWIGTFHAVCARLLRTYHDAAGLERSFVIYDDADQRAVMARVLKELDLDDRRYPPRQILARIHKHKQEGRTAAEFQPSGYVDDVVAKCFEAYERHLKNANAVDFEDLIVSVMRVAEDPESPAGQEIRRRFRHVLVDEFQDVNVAQYRLVRALVRDHANLCVVGDDDQSIYRWRGADVRNIRGFRRDFPGAKVVKLEQNYRSSGHIVKAALGVIRPAKDREPKDLWTANREGQPVEVVAALNEHDEAAFVVERVKALVDPASKRRVSPGDVAIFYRTHAQSRVLEEVMRAENVPYQIIGGTKFFERAEVKDLVAYLRVVDNPKSDVDLLRIINVPSRKIGTATIDRLIRTAGAMGCSLWEAIVPLTERGELGSAARKSLLSFRDLIQGMMREARTAPPSELAEAILERTGYARALEEDESAESDARLMNLKELVGSIGDYEDEMAAAGQEGTLAGWLERITLAADVDALEDAPRVAMMTVHAAKGLEFDTVFITGMEEELFPFKGMDPSRREDVEEERRLAYVAITRAREKLYVTHAARRMLFGMTRFGMPSRFLDDLPAASVRHVSTAAAALEGSGRFIDRDSAGLLRRSRGEWVHPMDAEVRRGGPAIRETRTREAGGRDVPAWAGAAQRGLFDRLEPTPEPPRAERVPGERFVEPDEPSLSAGGFARGQRVVHEKFGVGTVESQDGGDDPIVTVRFSGWGTKRIKARFLKHR